MPVGLLQGGEIYRTTYQGPYGHVYAAALNVVLDVNFNEDGTGEIAEGSYYPTEELDEILCTADIAILPITDALEYSSDLNADLIFPGANILGSIPDGDHDHPTSGYLGGTLIHAGEPAGSISLSVAEYFDLFPSTPVYPTLCDNLENCFDITLESGETISGGDELPGFAGGYVIKESGMPSIAPLENTSGVDLYIEWHAIDGPLSQSGLGDIIDEDEDGDGTDFDRIWAMESLMATYLNPSSECGGYNYPIYGDVTDELESLGASDCIDRVDIATRGYIFNASNVDFGYLVTYNSLLGGGDDSDHDYNGTDGRMVMEFEPLCIQDINIRHIMLEFVDLSCYSFDVGDINLDGFINVLDIVALANCVLADNCGDLECSNLSDINEDGSWNVLRMSRYLKISNFSLLLKIIDLFQKH